MTDINNTLRENGNFYKIRKGGNFINALEDVGNFYSALVGRASHDKKVLKRVNLLARVRENSKEYDEDNNTSRS